MESVLSADNIIYLLYFKNPLSFEFNDKITWIYVYMDIPSLYTSKTSYNFDVRHPLSLIDFFLNEKYWKYVKYNTWKYIMITIRCSRKLKSEVNRTDYFTISYYFHYKGFLNKKIYKWTWRKISFHKALALRYSCYFAFLTFSCLL